MGNAGASRYFRKQLQRELWFPGDGLVMVVGDLWGRFSEAGSCAYVSCAMILSQNLKGKYYIFDWHIR